MKTTAHITRTVRRYPAGTVSTLLVCCVIFFHANPKSLFSQPNSTQPIPTQKVTPQQQGTAQELYRLSRMARDAEGRGDYKRALELWQAVNDIKPGYTSAYSGIKRSYLALERFDEALAFLDGMLETALSGKINLDPVSIHADRVEVIFAGEGEETGRQAALNALEQFKGSEKIYLEISSVLAAQRLSDEALTVLLKGRTECRNRFLFARDLARWYEARMDWKSAIDEYLLYLEESPEHLNVVTGALGDISSRPDGDSLAVATIEARLRATSDKLKPVLRRLLAALHFRARRYDQALLQYKILERESGDLGRELLEFARLTASEREFELSRQAYKEVLAGNPGKDLSARALLGLGNAAEALGEIDSAAAAYRQILKPGTLPQYAFEAYSNLGKIEFRHFKNSAGARDYFDKALELAGRANIVSDQAASLEVDLGLTWEYEGDMAQAENIFKGVIKKTRRYPESAAKARYELCLLYFRIGEFEKSNREITNLVASNPAAAEMNEALTLKTMLLDLQGIPEALIAIGRTDLLFFQGKPDEALKVLETVENHGNDRVQEEILWKSYQISHDMQQFDTALMCLEDISNLNSALRKDLALLRAGDLCIEYLHNSQQAISYYEKIMIEFPDSPLADEARRRVREIPPTLLDNGGLRGDKEGI